MTRRSRFFITFGISVIVLLMFLVWRTAREDEFTPLSPSVLPVIQPSVLIDSPIAAGEIPRIESPLPVPATIPPPVTVATLDAIRASRPTATHPSGTHTELPYVAPSTWRKWAVRILAAAGVLAYVGLLLRRRL